MMSEPTYPSSEMAELDLTSLAEEAPEGHKSGFVAVAGRPNVGKSTLMNALLKQKVAIVSPRPQTTRTRQLGILTRPEYQIVFVDTPGLIKPRHKLDEFMVTTADESIHDADVVLWLVDAAEEPGPGDQAIAQTLQALPEKTTIILGINKADLLAPEEVVPRTDAYRALLPGAQWLLFSALNGVGLDVLLQMIIEALPEGPRYYPVDQTTDAFIRDIAAELIREQIFLQLRDELPYGTAVQVQEFKERDNGVTYISAIIYVERDNHKKIIIGTKGSQLRKIGEAARREIEQLIEGKVFLELWVKVEPQWRRSDEALRRFGYNLPK
ncbi:MAG: GTPase Era [Chloroflexi bacterium]|nr:GTPase Era [Chloroflexota bacterium]MCI0575905.1 GTPase Era [Chloroflexota bacterium]MCI0727719.1 GTPase Era [Chloroflexota bacterium]